MYRILNFMTRPILLHFALALSDVDDIQNPKLCVY